MGSGLCECGCGRRTRLSSQTDTRAGYVKGQPRRFVNGHQVRRFNTVRGPQHHNWKGGRFTRPDGYVSLWKPDHPRATPDGRVLEHIVIAERALGKPLPDGAQVHHVNDDRSDNRPRNLVICQDQAYHSMLHKRAADRNRGA